MTTFWCEHAWLGGADSSSGVVVDVSNGHITDITPGVPGATAGAVEFRGLTLPGLANAHSHAFHRLLRGRTQAATGSFWTWREQMYTGAEALDPDTYHRLARAVYAEMALAGITCVGEFHYVHHGPGGVPYAEANAMSAALVAAAADVGIRITLLDTCYLTSGIGVPANPTQLRFSDGDAARWAERASAAATSLGAANVRFGAAIHSVRAVDPASMEVVAAWARDWAAPLHLHLSEQPAENEQCLAAYGCTPTELLADHGVLGATTCAVHATHVTPMDIERLGSSSTSVCICPTTERDLADGIGPAGALRDTGSPLCLGSDSHAIVDLFEEARAVEMDERLITLQRGRHDAPSLLAAATANGHAALGWQECGRIEVGAPADLTTVRLDSVRTEGLGPALDRAVFTAAAADVHHVVVDGEVVVRDGRHTRLDVEAELRAAMEPFR